MNSYKDFQKNKPIKTGKQNISLVIELNFNQIINLQLRVVPSLKLNGCPNFVLDEMIFDHVQSS